MFLFDLRVPFLGVYSYTKTGFLIYSCFASYMIIRFGRCNTLCWVTLLRVERREADGMWGVKVRGWGKAMKVNVIKASCDRGRASELSRKGVCASSPRRVRAILVATLLMYYSLPPARLISSINCSRMP